MLPPSLPSRIPRRPPAPSLPVSHPSSAHSIAQSTAHTPVHEPTPRRAALSSISSKMPLPDLPPLPPPDSAIHGQDSRPVSDKGELREARDSRSPPCGPSRDTPSPVRPALSPRHSSCGEDDLGTLEARDRNTQETLAGRARRASERTSISSESSKGETPPPVTTELLDDKMHSLSYSSSLPSSSNVVKAASLPSSSSSSVVRLPGP
jgi:hypothetical protein